jgi:hypothetical protein
MTDMPYGLMVGSIPTHLDDTGSVPSRCVPVSASTHKFLVGKECSRTQFLACNWVCYYRLHKSQGVTLDKIVIRLPSKKDFALGLACLTTLRVKELSGL